MKIALFDDSFPFDGYTPYNDPMGGPQKGVVHLATALARRGHSVAVHNRCDVERSIHGVQWCPLDDGTLTDTPDLVVAVRRPVLLEKTPSAGRRLLLLPDRAASDALLAAGPGQVLSPETCLVFQSESHRAGWPESDHPVAVIRPGVADVYLKAGPPIGYWPPRAITLTHPRGGLQWLLELWCRRIEPLVKGAELHLFSSLFSRASAGLKIESDLMPLFREIESASSQGVRVRRPLPDADMAEEYRRARVFLHPGSSQEVYPATLAESQASGCPGVAFFESPASDYVVDGRSGFQARSDDSFGNCAVLCLKEDIVYMGRSKDARDMQRGRNWDDAAQEYEALF